MSKYICPYCERDCGSQMTYEKHETKCLEKLKSDFTNRFSEDDICPKCAMLRKSFYRVNENILVCLDCGTLFMKKAKRVKLQAKLKLIKWQRP